MGDHLINANKALRLGIEGKLRFFVPVEQVTIVWGEAIKSSEAGRSEELFDPQFCLDIGESLYFQVTRQSLGEIFRSREKAKKTKHIELVFPEPLKEKSGTWDAGVRYQSRIKNHYLLWPSELFDITGKSVAEHLRQQRERSIEDLFVSREDVALYEKKRLSEVLITQKATEQDAPMPEQGVDLKSLPGAITPVPDADAQSLKTLRDKPGALESVPIRKLCSSFGYGPNSSTGVINKLREYNKRFPESPFDFHRGKGGARCLYQFESWHVISKVGASSGRRKTRKSSKKQR